MFGCAYFPNLRAYNSHKFSYHTTKCVFLGMSSHHKGFLCLSSTGRLYISRHVVFNEADFPFQHNFLNTKSVEQQISYTSPLVSSDNSLTWQNVNSSPHVNTGTSTTTTSQDSSSLQQNPSSTEQSSSHSPVSSPHQTNSSPRHFIPIHDTSQFEVNLDASPTVQNTHEDLPNRVVTRSMRGISKPKVPYIGTTTSQPVTEPNSVSEALTNSHWKRAMEEEINDLHKNHTWELVPYHSG